MKRLFLVCSILLISTFSVADSFSQKVYVNVRYSSQETQIGIRDGAISMYDENSGTYYRFTVKSGKIDKQVKLEKKTNLQFVENYSYCPFHHTPAIYSDYEGKQ